MSGYVGEGEMFEDAPASGIGAPWPAGLVLVPVNTHDQGYRTTYRLYIREEDQGRALLVGTVKIGSTEQQPGGHALRAGRYSSLNANGRRLWRRALVSRSSPM
ncbi:MULTISPECIES: hypothetical protein [unclassified Streptomyces]|uniref:hypothetical protein n=1 Tax=unclassified Streptomyces TaxID=2593676 RepID=UPI002259C153|nr:MULTISPECIES: hypothetical protein [unclassified Streptomyces]MCX4403670.1 hypothetical protein [Streptomyces sp. NBC_01764]MCX5181375.1 hypothetical protein [Streptomyces sp. NBC_00268]